jgi:CHAD domain-containing protein
MQASRVHLARGLFLSGDEAFMVRVLEVVLSVPQPTVCDRAAHGPGGHQRVAEERMARAPGEAVAGLPHVVPAPRVARQTTTWFDSNGTLAQAGLQVRLNATADERRIEVWRRTQYSPGVTLHEMLYEATLEADALVSTSLNGAPDAFKETLSRAGDLLPGVTLSHDRECWQRVTPEGIAVGITFDRFAIEQEDEVSPHRQLRLTTPYLEDAVSAALAALFAVANELVAALAAFPELHGASDRAREGDAAAEPVPARAAPIDLSGVSTPHGAFIAICNNLADHWFGNDAGVRDALSPEFVHQMRVAQRRLKTAMRIFPHWRDDAWTSRVAPDLKWLGSMLGEARDRDVFVDSTLPTLAAADAQSARWNPTREDAHARRLEARGRAQVALGSARYAHLALAWLEWLSALPCREPPAKAADTSLRRYANKHIRKYYERLVSAPKLTTLDDHARHEERIQAKYLRYALEFFDSIVSPKTRNESAKTVSRMQSVLGDGNDAAVALRELEQMDVEPYQLGFARGWCEASKRYTAQEGERLLRTLRAPKITGGDAD